MLDMKCGIFEGVEQAVQASRNAFAGFSSFLVKERIDLINDLRIRLLKHAEELSVMEREETGMGIAEDKKIQILRAISGTPGPGFVKQDVRSDEEGLTLEETYPFGVCCAVHPVNHPVASIINSCIMLLSAGNSVINLIPRRAENVGTYTVRLINQYIYEICGISNLAVCMEKSRYEYNRGLMEHPDVALIMVTGGNDIVNTALSVRKRVIAAGSSNPVVIVDEDCDVEYAARLILEDICFDNNLLCTSEKSAVVHTGILYEFIEWLSRKGVMMLDSCQADRLLAAVFKEDFQEVRREFIGKSAEEILSAAGIRDIPAGEIKAIAFETEVISPFVIQEVAAPILPIVRADSFEEAVLLAAYIEQGRNHTAAVFSNNVHRLSAASRLIPTCIFIKNGSTLYGAGIKGNSPVTFTVANISGEGPVTPEHLVRHRNCILANSFERR